MSRNLSEDLNNPYLFIENKPGDYQYGINESGGKNASGFLCFADRVERDRKSQLQAGHSYRRKKDHMWGVDDGGHLIGARFGGSSGDENLTAQDRNVNRGTYNKLENEWAKWAKNLDNGYKVFVHIETDHPDRPNAYMGYMIYEMPNGKRGHETFSIMNENNKQQSQWELDAAEIMNEKEQEIISVDEKDQNVLFEVLSEEVTRGDSLDQSYLPDIDFEKVISSDEQCENISLTGNCDSSISSDVGYEK